MDRNPEVPASNQDEALFLSAAMCEESRGAPQNANGDLTSLRRHEQSPRSTRIGLSGSFPGGANGKKTQLPMQETQETWVSTLGLEDTLEKEMVFLSIGMIFSMIFNILA